MILPTPFMAHHPNLTPTLLLHSHSPSGGDKDEAFDEDGYEKSPVFYDTVVLESPIRENDTQLEKFCFDTQVVDDDMGHTEPCELDNEIVLDSEDEGSCRITSRSEKNVSRKREGGIPCLDAADSIDKQLGAAMERSSVHPNSSDGKQEGDHEIGRLEYVDSRESEESSQATALCFVDNFLSFNIVDMCQGVEDRTRIKSPLVSGAKGTQRLAKIIERGSPVKEVGAFEWFESCQQAEADSFIKRGMVSSEFGDYSHQDLHSKGSRSLSNKHKEGLAHLHNDIGGPSHSLSIFKDQCSEVSIGIEKQSEGNDINGSFKEFDELMPTKSSSEKFEVSVTARDVPDMFDVGIGTQIAAEAMEALYYGLPPSCNTGDTYEENTFTDLWVGETKSRTCLERNSLPKIAACELVGVAQESIRRKRSARRYNKDIYSLSWNYNYQKLSHKIKPNGYKCKQSKVDESVSSNNLKKCETYVSPSIPDEPTLLRKQPSKEEPVIRKSRHSDSGFSVKKINDQVDKPKVTNNVNEESMLTYKRKKKRLVADPPPKLLSGKQKCSKHSSASTDASDGKPSEQQQSIPVEAAIARLLRLDSWNCPKGKRTHRKVTIHSSGESMHASFTSVGAEEQNLDSVRSKKMPEDGEINSSNFNMKGQMRTNLSRLSLENNSDESQSRKNCNVQVAGDGTNSDLAAASISARDLDRARAAQNGKPDYVDSTSIINGLKNHNSGESPKNSIESSGTEFNTTLSCKKSVNMAPLNNRSYVYQRRPCNRNLPKPSLLKELMGLGVPELISDFAHRGFRTRKELTHVRVLFSQHLDDDVIKQQKKISARLGISIASCSMDATHFIADKFVRTMNMLEAIAVGKPVVTPLWLESCGQASCLLDEKKYILRDAKKEKEIGFSMAVSLARARQYPLLKDKKVYITQNVKPNKEMITSLVKAVGGEVVETSQKMPARDQKIQVVLLILSCEQDLVICTPLLEKGAAVYSSELLLNGIVIQKLEYERHQLFPKFVKEKSVRSRKR